jgi:hypothetical protein
MVDKYTGKTITDEEFIKVLVLYIANSPKELCHETRYLVNIVFANK